MKTRLAENLTAIDSPGLSVAAWFVRPISRWSGFYFYFSGHRGVGGSLA